MGLSHWLQKVLGPIQSKLDFNDWSDYPQFSNNNGLGRIALLSCCLSAVGSIHLCALIGLSRWGCLAIDIDSNQCQLLWQWCAYMVLITCFHLLEFFSTALYNPTATKADSFLVNHSVSYTAAFFTSLTEFWVRFWLIPYCNVPQIVTRLSLVVVLLAQGIRSSAMITAGESFNHIIQTRRKENHVLVTHGIYKIFRHPSYVGFFYWSISVQFLLGNVLNGLVFCLASWSFFRRRIPYEEESLLQHFPEDYPAYRKKTWMGIPFIRSSSPQQPVENQKQQ